MRVLVTGASGFVGRQTLQPLLDRGFEVHAVARRALPFAGVAWHEADLLDGRAAREIVQRVRATHLLHLAWYAEPGKFWTSPENLRWVAATMELAHAFAASGGERIVSSGSCAEYDWRPGVCIEDETPLVPSTLYGAAKLAAWNILRVWCAPPTRLLGGAPEARTTPSLSFAWGRLFFMYGPAEPEAKLVASVILALLRGETARTTTGEQIRDFLHVSDAAGALVALLASDVEGAVNIGSGNGIAVRDLVARIGDLLGARERIEFGAIVPAAAEAPRVVADTRRLNERVGWRPRFDLRGGLQQTIDWWRRELAR